MEARRPIPASPAGTSDTREVAGLGILALASPPSPTVRQALAPAGVLRLGVHAGSPTSLLRGGASGEDRGLAVDLGRELARQLGVGWCQVEFPRAAAVLAALKEGLVDVAVTNATPARAADIAFTGTLVALELGYLVSSLGRLGAMADVDRAGVRVGVTEGSTSQAALTRDLLRATVVPVATTQAAREGLSRGDLDVFATNKAILFDIADTLPGVKVIDGCWGVERLALAMPRGREAGTAFLCRFAEEAKAGGLVRRAAERAGLRGTVEVAPC
jgi:polar amino acid transport system substrate-binding protein